MPNPPRIAARAVILHQDRLLIVNAWPGHTRLWCAPGGGVEPHASLPDNLAREVLEETGLTVVVGAPCLINEFHDKDRDFHQIEVFFRCTVDQPDIDPNWTDPEGIVNHRRWVTRAELETLTLRPKSLASVAWDDTPLSYDALEPVLK